MHTSTLSLVCFLLLLPSCIIRSPKYTSVEQVMTLEAGMKRSQVEKILGLGPYDVKSITDTSNVLVYVYRLTDRKTIPINTKPTNGRKTKGKYVPLAVTYSKDSVLLSLESCSLCQDNLMSVSKLDFQKFLAFLMVTAPAILIYLGFKN